MPRKIKVLVVDDSTFMRKALKRMLNSDPMIRTVGEADNGVKALEEIERLAPDVVTLDVRMPGMDGLQVLERIMRERPTPVLMVSSLTSEGGGVTMRALSAGAVDFIDKSSCHSLMDIVSIADTLIQKVKVVSGVDLDKIMIKPSASPLSATECGTMSERGMAPAQLPDENPSNIIAIGASTGGPMSLEKILSRLPANYTGAILIVQHMPIGFTAAFAERLNNICPMRVKEAEDNDQITSGGIYIAPGGYHLMMKQSGGRYYVKLSKNPLDTLHIPSVDVMIKSVAETWIGRMMGIILTGMGSDGAEGIGHMKKNGGVIVAQNEETCIVYGMPKAAYLSGAVDRVKSLDHIADEIINFI